MKIMKYIKRPLEAIPVLSYKGAFKWMPDEMYLKLLFRAIMKKKLDLNNPKTYSEKLQWIKLYDRNPLYTSLVDKYLVKEYVKEKIGEEYIIPTYGVWDSFDEIDFSKLPNQFVMKCTHDSGGLIICRDKTKLDFMRAKRKIEKYLKSGKVVSSNSLAHSNIPVSSVVTNAATSSNTNVRASAGIGAKADGGTSPSTKTSVKANVSFTSGNISAAWPKIVNNLKQNGRIVLYTNLMNTSAKEINDMTVGIEFPNGITSFGKTVLEKQENIYEISKLVSMACGKEMQIKYISGTANVQKAPTPVENIQNLAKESDIPFNVIE